MTERRACLCAAIVAVLSKMRDVAVLAVGMHQVVHGELSIGAFTAFTQCAAPLLPLPPPPRSTSPYLT